jgi:hypothetical protein
MLPQFLQATGFVTLRLIAALLLPFLALECRFFGSCGIGVFYFICFKLARRKMKPYKASRSSSTGWKSVGVVSERSTLSTSCSSGDKVETGSVTTGAVVGIVLICGASFWFPLLVAIRNTATTVMSSTTAKTMKKTLLLFLGCSGEAGLLGGGGGAGCSVCGCGGVEGGGGVPAAPAGVAGATGGGVC